jgi:hypothetical protein
MSVSINTSTFNALTAQPFGYNETDTSAGLVAQKVRLSGLLTPAEWSTLTGIFGDWRDLRIEDPDSVTADDIGHTVDVSFSANGLTWTEVECWFSQAPAAEQVGAYLSVTCELVDAAQALEVAKRESEKANDRDRPALGTFTLGSSTITLSKPPETYQDNPQVRLTTTGRSYIEGPLAATKVYAIEGTCDAANWAALREWFEEAVTTRPDPGDYFPITPPSANASNKIVDGLKVIEYAVSITIVEAR